MGLLFNHLCQNLHSPAQLLERQPSITQEQAIAIRNPQVVSIQSGEDDLPLAGPGG